MNKRLSTLSKGLALSCACLIINAHAGDKLNEVDAQVAQKARQIDEKHGVLLDSQERNALKLNLIVKQVVADSANDSTKSVSELAETAIATYEITDPTEQRKLLIGLEAQAKSTGSSSNQPDYP